MKILKSAVVAFSLAIAMGSFSTSALAEAGRTSYKPADAIKNVQDLITAAETGGATGDELSAQLRKAADMAEEINANDKVSRESSKGIKALKAAAAAAKAGNAEGVKENVAKAKEIISGLNKLL